VTAGDKEGRDTRKKSEKEREEDEEKFGPIGREGKNRLGNVLLGGVANGKKSLG
jgi:hypothetical protein